MNAQGSNLIPEDENSLPVLNGKVTRVESDVRSLGVRLDGMSARLDGVSSRLDHLEREMVDVKVDLAAIKAQLPYLASRADMERVMRIWGISLATLQIALTALVLHFR